MRIKEVGLKRWLREQDKKWQCQKCGGRIIFYQYKCFDCGLKYNPK
jgi:DNA-directed RNA polymerase subunit RPC12/RpoP